MWAFKKKKKSPHGYNIQIVDVKIFLKEVSVYLSLQVRDEWVQYSDHTQTLWRSRSKINLHMTYQDYASQTSVRTGQLVNLTFRLTTIFITSLGFLFCFFFQFHVVAYTIIRSETCSFFTLLSYPDWRLSPKASMCDMVTKPPCTRHQLQMKTVIIS